MTDSIRLKTPKPKALPILMPSQNRANPATPINSARQPATNRIHTEMVTSVSNILGIFLSSLKNYNICQVMTVQNILQSMVFIENTVFNRTGKFRTTESRGQNNIQIHEIFKITPKLDIPGIDKSH